MPRIVRALAAAAALALPPGPAAAISEVYVSDPFSGIAIGGFDPVAYFVENRPTPGKPELEVAWDGAFWRFANTGNAAAFQAAPTVYAPAYGGHGVLGVASGVPQAGNPSVFAVHRDRLFFFYSRDDLARFLEDPDTFVTAADARWGEVLATLAR